MNTPTRRRFIAALVSAGALSGLAIAARAGTEGPLVEVWKSPSCGCCKNWIAHMKAHGFRVRVHEVGNTAARERLGIPMPMGSCHTARVGGYAIEGHVPARDVLRLLKDKPDAIGLAVPGMPVGSPGMDGPGYGGRRDPYDVLLVGRDGRGSVFSSYVDPDRKRNP
jgi:hypothetical protein